MSDLVAVVGFVGCAIVIFVAGRGLSLYGDRLGEIRGWSGAWVDLVLMASVTSLPELVVGISSAAVVGSADLAVGDVLGSCAVNVWILATLDAFVARRRPLFSLASSSHVLAAALGIILLTAVGGSLVSSDRFPLTPWIGASSALFLAVYLGAIRLIFMHAHRIGADGAIQPPLDQELVTGARNLHHLSTRQVVTRYALLSGAVVAAAILLPPMAEGIVRLTGLQESFVGTIFLAGSTSLPEFAVSLAAVRMGAIDLAVGNILGSNLFNILILALDDLAYTRGLLLADASQTHIFTILSTIAMSSIVIIGLTYQPRRKRFLLAWDSALILAVYVGNAALLLAGHAY